MFTGILNNEELDTLRFVDFEFLPHNNRWTDDFKQEVLRYSQSTGTTVFAGNDGDGLIVEDGTIQIVGEVIKISDGKIC